MKKKIFSLLLTMLLLVSTAAPAFAQENQAADEILANTLRHYVEELKAIPDAEGLVAGYEVYSLDREQTTASYRSEKTFVPASALKLLVTAAAVNLWPEDLRLPTKIYLDGKLTGGGVLQGDIVLKGYGDPVLTTEKLNELAKALTNQGVRRVKGNIVVDDSYFQGDPLGPGWMWDDEPYAYSAQIGALSVNGNTIDVKIKPTRSGKKPKVTVKPAPEYVKVINKAKTQKGSDEDLSIERIRAKNKIIITGTIGEEYNDDEHEYYEVTRTIVEPAKFTGHVLRDLLKENGVDFHHKSKVSTGQVKDSDKLVGEVNSPRLDKILRKFVKESDNLIGEMLVKQLGAREKEDGTTKAGLNVIRQFVKEELGLDDGFVQVDGSGLSRLNQISPHHFIQLLKAMENHPEGDRFLSFLPIAGVDGTLENRMEGTPAEGNVTAKTGSMSGVSSLVGYVTSSGGERFAYSVLTNGAYKIKYSRELQDNISIALAKYPDLPGLDPITEEEPFPLSDQLDPILDDNNYKRVMKGAMVYSLDRDKILYERNAQSLLTPGSSTKLLTSATALAKLGPDYRFQTNIYKTGKIHGGVLHGDVVIKGHGDPTLAPDRSLRVLDGPTMEQMAEDLKKLGIRRIQGDIIVDATAFAEEVYGTGWPWDNESHANHPQITALSVNRGTVGIDYSPGKKPGEPVQLTLKPKNDHVKIENKAVTGKKDADNTLKIQRVRGTNTIRITGSLPVNADSNQTRITVEKPHVFAGHILRDKLSAKGISFHPHSTIQPSKKPVDAELLETYKSQPLSDIVSYLNHHNDNFYAEMILKTIGLEVQEKGTFGDGIDVIHNYLEEVGIASRFDMMDGSGFTRYNQISAEQFVSLLAEVENESFFSVLYEALPVAGERGVLKDRMTGTAAEHDLRGITGSSRQLRSLTGYVETADGERLAYSILTNGYSEESLNELVDQFGAALAATTQ